MLLGTDDIRPCKLLGKLVLHAEMRSETACHPCVSLFFHAQTTSDLAGFWATSYKLVLRDVKDTFKRHYW